MDWTVQDLGALGEFVGALGVVITLIYLAFQIRQNTTQLEQNTLTARAAAVNASQATLRENRLSVFESAEMSTIWLHGHNDPEAMNELDQFRFRLVMQNVTEAMLDVYTQTAVTDFSPETWATQGATMVERVLGTDGGQRFWEVFAGNYPLAFRDEVDRILGTGR